MIPEITVGFISTGTAVITAFAIVYFTKRSEEKRHRQQLVMQAAIENWKCQVDAGLKTGNNVSPIHAYILYAVKMMQVIDDDIGVLSVESAKAHMRDLDAFVMALDEEVNKDKSHAKT